MPAGWAASAPGPGASSSAAGAVTRSCRPRTSQPSASDILLDREPDPDIDGVVRDFHIRDAMNLDTMALYGRLCPRSRASTRAGTRITAHPGT